MSRALTALLLVLAFALLACKGGGGESAADRVAQETLLRLEDFPSGWTERVNGDDAGGGLELPSECQAFVDQSEFPDEEGHAESSEFRGPNDESVSSDTTIFADSAGASEAIGLIEGFFESCRQPMADALQSLLEADDAVPLEDLSVAVNLDRLSIAPHGDESVALRLSADVSAIEISLSFYIDLLVFRSDEKMAAIFFTQPLTPPDQLIEERLLTAVQQRVED
jgi:hypothetical protein